MATVSGGSKPTFTVDQVLHAVEMNQLNQEWIVDSVPAGSAGKNGDVVFVINQGGVWAKVSGSWVQASLTSADMQALQDQVDTIQSNGYDDSELRGLIQGNTDALDGKSDDGHTHADLGGDPYDDSELRGLISDEETARVAGDAGLQDQIDTIQSSGYDDTQLRSDFAAADAATLSSANTYTDQEIAAITVPDVSDLATKTEVSDGDTATLTAANAYTDGKVYDATSLEADVAQNTSDISDLQTEQSTQDDAIQANTDALSNKSDSTHTHPPQDLTHNHDAEYQPVGDYALDTHTHPPQDLTHDHDAQYAPVHNHPYASDDHSHPPQDLTHDHQGEYQPVDDYPTKTEMTAADAAVEAKIPDVSNFATKTELTNGLAEKADDDHVHIQTGSGLTFDPSREGQIVQSTNGTDWTAGMSLRVVTSVPDDTEGEIGDVVFVVGA